MFLVYVLSLFKYPEKTRPFIGKAGVHPNIAQIALSLDSRPVGINEILAELPALSVSEWQRLIRRAMDIDEAPLSVAPEAVIDQRRAAHQQDPTTAIPPEEMKARLRN